jgi:hypothetical protein
VSVSRSIRGTFDHRLPLLHLLQLGTFVGGQPILRQKSEGFCAAVQIFEDGAEGKVGRSQHRHEARHLVLRCTPRTQPTGLPTRSLARSLLSCRTWLRSSANRSNSSAFCTASFSNRRNLLSVMTKDMGFGSCGGPSSFSSSRRSTVCSSPTQIDRVSHRARTLHFVPFGSRETCGTT